MIGEPLPDDAYLTKAECARIKEFTHLFNSVNPFYWG